MDYRTETNGDTITLWNDDEGIGLQFKKGERLQRYQSSLIVKDPSLMETGGGIVHLNEVGAALTLYAIENYPEEFKEIKSLGL